MKLFLKFLFVLTCIAVLLAGGFATGLFWDKINPFFDKTAEDELLRQWLQDLRKACVTEDALKGTALRPATTDPEQKQINLVGIVAKKDQIALVESRAKALLESHPKLAAKYSAGIGGQGLQVFPIEAQISRLQTDFDEGKAADGATAGTALEKRLVPHWTRLDNVTIGEDGQLHFQGVCIRGTAKKDATLVLLNEIIRRRLAAYGASPQSLPDVVLEVQMHDYPIAGLQKLFEDGKLWPGVHVLAASYDRDGRFHLDGLLKSEDQRKPVETAINDRLQDAGLKSVWQTPKAPSAKFDLRLVAFDADARAHALQAELVKTAQKDNKPAWHRIRLTKLAAAMVADDGKEARDFPQFQFQVSGRFLEAGDDAKLVQKELPNWLAAQLPNLAGPDLTPIAVKLDLTVRASPVEALQRKIVERGLDGAVFTDARYAADGKLELHGRVARPDDKGRTDVQEAVFEILVGHSPYTLATMKPHETRADAKPIAWSDVLRETRSRLAKNDGPGRRTRLDRLFFRYDKQQLRLDGEGAFLADSDKEAPVALNTVLDEVIASRGEAGVSPQLFKRLPNPLTAWQQKIAEQAGLDGALITELRYDVASRLQIDGYLGAIAQKEPLRALLSAQLARLPEALKGSMDKERPDWSMNGFTLHQSLQGNDRTWTEIAGAFQADLASSDEPTLRHMRLDRALFVYRDQPRRLALQWHATLIGAADGAKDPALQKLDGLSKKLLPKLTLAQVEPTIRSVATPIYALQKVAVMNQLDGVLIKDAVFSAAGKLQFDGLRGSDEHPKKLDALLASVLDDKSKAIASAGVVPFDRLKLVPWRPLLEELRQQFAESAAPLLKQTRVDRVFFQYDDKAIPELWVKGVSVYRGKNPTVDQRATAWTAALKSQFKAHGLDGYGVALGLLESKENPTLELQRKAIEAGMDGVVFRVVGFDAKGSLRIQASAPKGQEDNVRKLLDEAAKKQPYLMPFQRISQGVRREKLPQFIKFVSAFELQEKTEPFDWQGMLAELRQRFARSGVAILEQTRIDRAYFSLNEDDPDQLPFLNFKGICLRSVHDDEKQIKELLRKELTKVNTPATKYVLKIDEIQIHDSPIYALQSEAVARRQNDPALNVLFERAAYAADGNLLLYVLALENAAAAKIVKLYQEDRPLPPELWKLPDGKAKAPTLMRRDFDWPGALKRIRVQFADAVDPLLQRSRFDGVHFAFSADRKSLHLHVAGVCVHPSALVPDVERDKVWRSFVNTLIPKVAYEPTTSGMIMLTNPSIVWQDDAASRTADDGIFFELARFDAQGKLKLVVMLPTTPQRAAALKIIADKPVPAKLAPIDEKNLNFQVWSWKEVIPKGQERLAQGEFLQHRTRLDRVFLQYEPRRGEVYLHLEGVSLQPTEVETPELLRTKLERIFLDLLPIALDHKLHTAGIRFLTSPIYALQTEAVARSLDGLLFADGRYDDQGRLHLAIVLGEPGQRAIAVKLVQSQPMSEGVLRPKQAKDQPILDITEIAWRDILKETQAWLARNSDTLLRKTRLDRGFFSYPANKVGPDLNLALVGIYPKKDALHARLKKQFGLYAQLYMTEQLRAGPVTAAPIVEHLDNPATIVQTKVLENPMLDGVRLDDASFDAAGKLILHGLWVGKHQQTPLDKLIHDALPKAHPSVARGKVFEFLQTYDSPGLLHSLRVWVADQPEIDEVWLERLYFDSVGKVRVSGFSTRKQDKERVDRQLPERLPVFPNRKLPSIEGAENETKPAVKLVAFEQGQKNDGPSQLAALTNIAEHLRAGIPKLKACDGLRIDRCFYDPEGVFRIEGLADRVNHVNELKPFLDGNGVPFDAKRQLGKGWRMGRITVIALRPMMVALHEALAAVNEFDGVTLTRAHHDAKNRLVLTATAVGDADPKKLEPILLRLLRTHPRWRLRTTAGVVVDISDRRQADVELAHRLVMRALALLQVNIGEARIESGWPTPAGWWSHAWPFDTRLPRERPTDQEYDRCLEYLDAALLHNPKNVTAWYLRGYVLQTKDRADLSLRDLRRMVAYEEADRELRHKRILDLELVQGRLRQSAARIEADAILEVASDWVLRVLRESPVARDEAR